MPVSRSAEDGLPAGAPPPMSWQGKTPTSAPSSGMPNSAAQLAANLNLNLGPTRSFASSDSDPIWGLSADKAQLPVLWERGSQPYSYTKPMRPGDDELPLRTINVTGGDNTTKTYTESLREFYNFQPEQLRQIQTAMWGLGLLPSRWNAGLLGNNNDKDSFAAWKDVVQIAVQSEKTVWEVLQGGLSPEALKGRGGSGGGRGRGGGSGRAPLQIRYSNPDDLKTAATAAAQDTLGYVPQGDFLDDFVKLYQGMEAGAQRKAYGGGSFTEPGNAQVQATKLAKKQNQTAADAYGVVKQFDALMGILGVEQ